MRRRGHGRPAGTTTRARFTTPDLAEPQLLDVTRERDTDRWYEVVGVEEHRDSPAVWWLTLERLTPDDGRERCRAGARYRTHTRDR